MSQHSNYYIFRSCSESHEIIFREHKEDELLEEGEELTGFRNGKQEKWKSEGIHNLFT